MLKTYWITLKPSGPLVKESYGVTAFDAAEALRFIKEKHYNNLDMPPVVEIRENIKFSNLDQNHVACNMWPIVVRGVWYPMN